MHGEKDKKFIHKKMTDIKNGFVDIFSNLSLLLPELSRIAQTNSTGLLNNKKNAVEDFLKKHPHMVSNNLEASISFMKSTEVNVCADELSRLRGGALCDICSGNSQIYFIKGKALISTESCNQLYSKCESQLSVASVFMNSFHEDLKILAARIIRIQDIDEEEIDEELKKKRELMLLLLKSHSHSQADKVRFCEKLIKLVDEPLFFELLSQQSAIQALIKKIRSRIASMKGLRCLQSNGGNFQNNQIQLPPSNFEMQGDLIVMPVDPRASIDSSYTSYFGATGTTMNEASHHRRIPLNLTSVLP